MSRHHHDPCVYDLIDLHFAARTSPSGEAIMRSHLPRCARCRNYYDRWLLLSTLDPQGKSAQQRMMLALGLVRPEVSGARPIVVSALCAVVLSLIFFAPGSRPAADFTPRGAAPATAPELAVYRIHPTEPLPAQGGRVHAHDELAFSYTNPTGFRYLLLFGVDEYRNVYWYYPAWTNAADNPVGIDLSAGSVPRELTQAIRHDLAGRTLTLHALFLSENASVRTIESRVRSMVSPGDTLAIPGAHEQRIRLSVEP